MKNFFPILIFFSILFLCFGCPPADFDPGEPDKPMDIHPPICTGGISFQDILPDSISILWGEAYDNVTVKEKLQYKVVKCLTKTYIDTIEKANSITTGDLVTGWTENITSVAAGGLAEYTSYWFTVLVKDESGNIAMYPPIQTTTAKAPVNPLNWQIINNDINRQVNFSCCYVSGNYLYATVSLADSCLKIFDIANPVNPVIITTVDLPKPSNASHVIVEGGYAYVTDSYALHIIDVYPEETAYIKDSISISNAICVAVSGNYAYVASDSPWVDIVEVSTAQLNGTISPLTCSHSVTVEGNSLYIADLDGGLKIYDISDPALPVYDTTIPVLGDEFTQVAVKDNYAYVAGYPQFLSVINITTSSVAGYLEDPNIIGNSITINGDYAYACTLDGGLKIIDISSPGSPNVINELYPNMQTLWISIHDHYAYVVNDLFGLDVIDITSPVSAIIAGHIDTPFYTSGVEIKGHYAFLAGYISGLEIADISTPSAASGTHITRTSTLVYGVAVSGDYAYVCCQPVFTGDKGSFQVIDISNTGSPVLVKTIEIENGFDVAVSGNYAFIAGYTQGLVIVDVSSPKNAHIVHIVNTPHNDARGLFLGENYVYVADYTNNIVVVDITSPLSAFIDRTISYSGGGSAYTVAVRDNLLYVGVHGSQGFYILDFTGTILCNITAIPQPIKVCLRGDYAFIAGNLQGFFIIDTSNPATASIKKTIVTSGGAVDCSITDEYAFVATMDYGLTIIGN